VIQQMKKISLVVMDKHREESLLKLREIGIVHVEGKEVSSKTLSQLFDRKAEIENSLGILDTYEGDAKAAAKAKTRTKPEIGAAGKDTETDSQTIRRASDFFSADGVPFSSEALGAPDRKRDDLVDHVVKLEEKKKFLYERVNILAWERSRIESWGSFNPDDIRFLGENGIDFYLYEFSFKDLENIPAEIPYIVVGKGKTAMCVVALDKEIPGKTPFEVGEQSLSETDELLADVQEQLADINRQLLSLVARRYVIQNELDTVLQQIEFETANAGMDILEEAPQEYTVSWITGFVPSEKIDTLKQAAGENSWALIWSDPSPTDSPPTQIKSSAFVRIIHPLFSFLGTIPGYKEFDISPSYLVFFSIFFAMIFGDAAYGLLILGIALFLGFSSKKKSGAFPDIAKFLLLLSCTTIVWGTITGSWFMISHQHLPLFLNALIIPPFNNTGPVEFPVFLQSMFNLPGEVPADELKTRWSIQFLCFSLAVIQLSWARAKRIMRLLPSLTAVAQAGWLLLMLGLYFLVLSLILGTMLQTFTLWIIGAGIFLILVFSEQNGGNFFANIGKGFAGLFPIFLKVVGCFADIISYIRLFAVGLAGAYIGSIFNQMAFPSEGLGDFGIGFLVRLIIAVVLVVFGHTLNLALTALSVIVHGVRLNLLEYAGNHLEMEWSGYEYNPFASKQKNK